MPLSTEIIEDAQELLAQQIATGFHTREWIIDNAIDYYSEEADERELRKAIPRLFDVAMEERAREMAEWPEVTDCDRLDAAFEELNAKGIMARHNWLCCGNCGQAAMLPEYERVARGAKGAGGTPRGYVFYHQQDTEGAADGGSDGLCLSYGSTRPEDVKAVAKDEDAASVVIGKEVAKVLNRHGLRTEWDGTIDMRIVVKMEWRRRGRPARWCEE